MPVKLRVWNAEIAGGEFGEIGDWLALALEDHASAHADHPFRDRPVGRYRLPPQNRCRREHK